MLTSFTIQGKKNTADYDINFDPDSWFVNNLTKKNSSNEGLMGRQNVPLAVSLPIYVSKWPKE